VDRELHLEEYFGASPELLEKVLKRITEIESSAKQAARIDDLDDLTHDAELQGQFRGYLCPVTEIQDEGELVIDLVDAAVAAVDQPGC
jgi:hypothetical protein